MKALLERLLLVCLLFALSASAYAQFPSRTIKIIVPIPAGGAPDIAARVVGLKLAELLGQPVAVENHAGSNGNIAGDLVAKSAPDGHTLLLGQDSLIAINPHLYAKMSFDPLKDLVPVATVASNQFVLDVLKRPVLIPIGGIRVRSPCHALLAARTRWKASGNSS